MDKIEGSNITFHQNDIDRNDNNSYALDDGSRTMNSYATGSTVSVIPFPPPLPDSIDGSQQNSSGQQTVNQVQTQPTTGQQTVSQVQPTTVTVLAPRVGEVKGSMCWTGGSNLKSLLKPRSAKAFCLQGYKKLIKVEELCTQGLETKLRLDVSTNKTTVRLTQWIKEVRTYMEDRDMDTIFRMYNHKTKKEYYLLKKWSYINKPNMLELWINQLKRGVKH